MAINRLRIIQGIAIFIIAASTAAVWLHFGTSGSGAAKGQAKSPVLPAMSVGGPFALVNHDGQTVTDADFRGKFMLVLFGYTFCPDVCPTGLSMMAGALNALGQDEAGVVPIFISIDPERDTPGRLKEYVPNFHPRLVGLTGSPEQVSAAASAYRVFFNKIVEEGKDPENYAMGHSNFIYLMGPDGKNLAVFSGGTSLEDMIKEIRKFL